MFRFRHRLASRPEKQAGDGRSLLDLPAGASGVITSVGGGKLVRERVSALGVRPGKLVTRVSAQFMGGPVVVLIDGRQTAMGRGIAAKIAVDPETPAARPAPDTGKEAERP